MQKIITALRHNAQPTGEQPASALITYNGRELGEPVLLKIPQVAHRLNIGNTSVYELIRSGRLASVKIGKSIRVPTAAVYAFLESLTQDGRC